MADKPLTEFRRRSSTGSVRLNQCRQCHNRAERHRRACQRAKRDDRLFGQFHSQLAQERNDKRVGAIIAKMFARFGGLERFASAWFQHYRRASARGGAGAFRFHDSMIRMMQHCESRQPDLSEVSDEDLERQMMEATKRVIQQEPAIAMAAASELGWTIVPPDCVDR